MALLIAGGWWRPSPAAWPSAARAASAEASAPARRAGLLLPGPAGAGGQQPLPPLRGLLLQLPGPKPRTHLRDDLRDEEGHGSMYRRLFVGAFPGFVLAFYVAPGVGPAALLACQPRSLLPARVGRARAGRAGGQGLRSHRLCHLLLVQRARAGRGHRPAGGRRASRVGGLGRPRACDRHRARVARARPAPERGSGGQPASWSCRWRPRRQRRRRPPPAQPPTLLSPRHRSALSPWPATRPWRCRTGAASSARCATRRSPSCPRDRRSPWRPARRCSRWLSSWAWRCRPAAAWVSAAATPCAS